MANEVSSWFGLKRPNFILDPHTDAEFYAPRTGVDIPILLEGIQINLITERPPKRFFWGMYGGGKTHTLFHISWQLEKLLPIEPIYVECPSVPKNSTFLDLYHDGIMASMGQDFVIEMFKKLLDSMGTVRFEEVLIKLKDILQDEELSRAVASLLGARPDKELIFWRYISGVSVPSRDLNELNLTQALSETIPSRLADIIIVIGRVLKRIKGKTLVLILDEIDRLKSVVDNFGASTYEEAFRRLVDENQRDVAIVMGCSAVNLRELPDFFGSEQSAVLSRVGTHNLIPITEISSDDVDNFIKRIIEYIVDKEIAKKKIEEHKTKTKEKLDLEFYPFTKEAVEALKGTLRGIMTPREITQRMSDAAGKAFLMKQLIITKSIVGG